VRSQSRYPLEESSASNMYTGTIFLLSKPYSGGETRLGGVGMRVGFVEPIGPQRSAVQRPPEHVVASLVTPAARA
jgi:hypothetical protein